MRFYDALYDTVAAAEASGNPTRTWVLETNEYGFCYLDTPWLVSGDDLYYAENGDPTLPIGTVLMQETKAPEGYFINDEVYLVKILESGADTAIIGAYNAPITPEYVLTGNIQITKTTRTGLDKHLVPEDGAVFEIYLKSAGSYTAAAETDRALLTTDANGVALAEDLPYGTYTVHQIKGWEGSAFCDDFDVTIDEHGKTYSYEIENERFYSKVRLLKLDSRTGLPIAEANVGFQIQYPDGTLVSYDGTDTWYTDSTGTLTLPMDLEYGKGYKAVEQNAPTGYVLSKTPISFDVTADATTTIAGETVILVNVNNTPTSIEVSKVDTEDKGVSGASLQVLDRYNTVIDEWTTDGTGHMLYALTIGGQYTLRETSAPAGYVLAKDVTFTVADTTDIQGVSMVNKQVFIDKLDSDGNRVSGAKLQILDSAGKVIDEWTSSDTPHAANYLVIGESYTLHEAEAPAGYVRAADISFTVEETDENQTVSMTNKRVVIQKVDADSAFVSGAKLQVLDAAGKVVDEWTTGSAAHFAENLVAGKTYTLHEAEAPAGYVQAADMSFTVSTTDETQTISMVDKQVQIDKLDPNGKFLAGAKLQILNAAGEVVDEWTTGNASHFASKLVIGETYTLHEAETPDGYVTAKGISFTVSASNETQTVSMTDKQLVIEKVDANGNFVEGATLQLVGYGNRVIDEWTTDDKAHVVSGLVVGQSYVLCEVSAPTGYVEANRISFTVSDDGKVQTVSMVDKQVLISKETADGSALSGATMQLLDADGNVVDEWTTDSSVHAARDLKVGQTYTLHEAKAPAGYVCATDVKFTVSDNGKNQEIGVVDKQVLVEKLDADGKFVTGVVLQVLDSTGKVVDEWTTTSSAHAVNALQEGQTYTLHELTTPGGYVQASDISFEVSSDKETQTVSMTDMRVFIEKEDANGDALIGATIEILDSEDKVVAEWISDGTSYAVTGLKAGESYTMREVKAPAGYVLAADITITVTEDGKDKTYTMTDKQVFVEKLDADGNFVAGAKLQVLDSAGKVVDEWTTEDKPYAVCDLIIGETYTLREAETPAGYVTANDVEFTVSLSSATQTVSMTDMQVFVNKVKADDTGLAGAQMQILDADGKIVDSWTSDGTAHAVSGLMVGGHYIIHEVQAPEGYVIAADMHFDVADDGKNQSYSMKDKQVLVEKLDAEGNFVPGAELQVLDATGKVVDEWTTEDAAHAVSNLVIGKAYILHESETPEGYVTSNDVAFTVSVKSATQTVSMTDMRVYVSKVDVDGTPVSGAKLQVLNKSGSVVDEWTTDGNLHAVIGLQAGESYTLHEVSAPSGFVLAADMELVIEDNCENKTFTMTDKQVLVKKVDANGNVLSGAKLQVLDATGKVVDEWVSSSEPHAVSNLVIGAGYTLHEAATPDGYVTALDVPFTVALTPDTQTVSMTDMRVFIEKLDMYGDPLVGAKLQVLDSKNIVIDEWTSDGTPYAVTGLVSGEEYTIRETEAPAGYTRALDVSFTVENSGKDQTYKVINKQVLVEKMNAEGQFVLGAKLQVLDATGKVVDEWTTDDSAHKALNLAVGERYTLHEATTPDGYVTAGDISFLVKDDKDRQTVIMTDMRVYIEKLDVDLSSVRGAKLEILDSKGNVVDSWTTDGTPYAVSGLIAGATYTLHEASAPAGYVRAEDISFTVTENGKDKHYTMTDKQVYVEKVDDEGNFVSGAVLQVLNSTGTVVDEWTTDGTPHAISNLSVGETYTLREAKTPAGYVTAKDISFVAELTPDTQTVSMVDMQVFVSKVTADNSALSGAQMQILDASGKVVDEWTTDGTVHAVKGLKAGESYIIREAKAPVGYVIAADMPFTLEDDGRDKSYTMTDKVVCVEKLDADGKAVLNAKLQILDAEGTVVDEWLTSEDPHAANNLTVGKTYTLHETETPAGFVTAKDVTFTVTDAADKQTVSMTDKMLLVEKVDPYGNPVTGATLQVLDKDGNVIDEWVTDSTAHAVIGLTAGESYVLHESAAPEGWLVSYDLPFTVEDDGLNQTVKFENEEIPVLKTEARVDDRHEALAKADITLTDTVTYEKLVPGRQYVLKGTLMDKATDEPLLNAEDAPITSSVTFTPEKSTGTVDVTFTYTPVAGSTVVVFQQIYKNDRLLASHEDIADENQTVHFPAISTLATIDGEKEAYRSSTVKLLDTVEYTNLTVGKEYTVKGVLMNKETGEPLKKDSNSDEVLSATATFTPETADGKIEVVFEFSGYVISSTTEIVVFEELYDGEYLVAEHEDIEDADQTVKLKVYHYYYYTPPVEPVESGDLGIVPYIFSASASILGMAAHIRKRREDEA